MEKTYIFRNISSQAISKENSVVLGSKLTGLSKLIINCTQIDYEQNPLCNHQKKIRISKKNFPSAASLKFACHIIYNFTQIAFFFFIGQDMVDNFGHGGISIMTIPHLQIYACRTYIGET